MMALIPPVDRRDGSEDRSSSSSAPQRVSGTQSPGSLGRINIRDWRRLGRAEQRFFETSLVFLEVFNLTLAELMAGPARPRADDSAPDMTARLDELEQNHRRRHYFMHQLRRQLDFDDRELRTFVSDKLRTVLGKTSPVDTWGDAADATALVLTIDTIVSGALVDPTYEMIGRVLGQHELLPSLAEFFDAQQCNNREALQEMHPLLRRFRTVSTTGSMIESTFDRSILPCVEFIRSIQRRFDCVGLGFLPDEMVSEVLDRIFEMTARSKPTG